MRLVVRFRNKEVAVYQLEDESFSPPAGVRKGFHQIGKAKDGGHPLVINLDDVVALEPGPDDTGQWGIA
jgi:hypothetical protein